MLSFRAFPQAVLYLVVLTLVACQLRLVLTKEVEATHEWTLLGDNDTVAAGMHIRMDLETGKKWVKLPDGQASEIESVAVSVSGEEHPVGVKRESSLFDYDMMHRTLDQLPNEEKARMQLPDSPHPRMTTEERRFFENRMKAIWLARQKELKLFEEEFLADLPKLLLDRIRRLERYISDPYKELLEMDLTKSDENTVTHIVSVLADLEFHLTDIDMTRDFYTLGGWPLLVAMLMDDTHLQKFNATPTEDTTKKIHAVQAHAAWALGTAVKNTGEFALYSVEPVSILDKKISPLTVLTEQLASLEIIGASAELQDKLQKYIYALGASLRGNPYAQRQFVSLHGGLVLGRLLESCVSNLEGDRTARKVVTRLLGLADDILAEAAPDEEGVSLSQEFSSTAWCDSALLSLQSTSHAELTALKIVRSLVPHCASWLDSTLRSDVLALHQRWETEAEEVDPDEHRERIALTQAILSVL